MELPEMPAATTIQSGSQQVQHLIKKNTSDDEFNNLFTEVEEPTMIIEPDFLQDLENEINDNTIQPEIIAPIPEDGEVVSSDLNIVNFVKPDYTNQMVNKYPTYNELNDAPIPVSRIKKYNIVDMFLLQYEGEDKIDNNPNLIETVKISYNQDFGNLRITFNQIPEIAKYNNIIFMQKMKQLVTGTIYPTDCFKAIHTETSFNCTETLINKTGESWEKERPVVAIQNLQNNEYYMWITDVVSNKQYTYHFTGWQGKAIEHCLLYCHSTGLPTRK